MSDKDRPSTCQKSKRAMLAAKVVLYLCLSSFAAAAVADIEKIAVPTESGIHFVWWPELKVPADWFHDREVSMLRAINVLVPDGRTFANAETIIYARAIYTETPGSSQSVRELIDRDVAEYRERQPSLVIDEATPVKIADGTELVSYTFFPTDQGNWEKVAYGEDGEFLLVFVVSSLSEVGFQRSLGVFEAVVASYTRESPISWQSNDSEIDIEKNQ